MEPTPNALDIIPLLTWRDKVDTPDPDRCLLCQKAIKDPRKASKVHMVDGGFVLIPTEQEYTNEAAEMGWWTVGPDCARKLPAGYSKENA